MYPNLPPISFSRIKELSVHELMKRVLKYQYDRDVYQYAVVRIQKWWRSILYLDDRQMEIFEAQHILWQIVKIQRWFRKQIFKQRARHGLRSYRHHAATIVQRFIRARQRERTRSKLLSQVHNNCREVNMIQ